MNIATRQATRFLIKRVQFKISILLQHRTSDFMFMCTILTIKIRYLPKFGLSKLPQHRMGFQKKILIQIIQTAHVKIASHLAHALLSTQEKKLKLILIIFKSVLVMFDILNQSNFQKKLKYWPRVCLYKIFYSKMPKK